MSRSLLQKCSATLCERLVFAVTNIPHQVPCVAGRKLTACEYQGTRNILVACT